MHLYAILKNIGQTNKKPLKTANLTGAPFSMVKIPTGLLYNFLLHLPGGCSLLMCHPVHNAIGIVRYQQGTIGMNRHTYQPSKMSPVVIDQKAR
jgi:hypothetical protein